MQDVPTAQEEGVADYEAIGWLGIMAPGAPPAKIIALLNEAINKTLQKPKIAKFFGDQGVHVVVADPSMFKHFLVRNRSHWEKVIKAAHIAPREN